MCVACMTHIKKNRGLNLDINHLHSLSDKLEMIFQISYIPGFFFPNVDSEFFIDASKCSNNHYKKMGETV